MSEIRLCKEWQITEQLKNTVKYFEGLVLTRYQDAGGIWTIGYGHVTTDPTLEHITETKADQLLDDDIQQAHNLLAAELSAAITLGQHDALTDFVFNLGIGTLRRSGIAKAMDAGQISEAARIIGQYDTVAGRKLPGLVARRAWEIEQLTRG